MVQRYMIIFRSISRLVSQLVVMSAPSTTIRSQCTYSIIWPNNTQSIIDQSNQFPNLQFNVGKVALGQNLVNNIPSEGKTTWVLQPLRSRIRNKFCWRAI